MRKKLIIDDVRLLSFSYCHFSRIDQTAWSNTSVLPRISSATCQSRLEPSFIHDAYCTGGGGVPSPVPPTAIQATSPAVSPSRPTAKVLRRIPRASSLPARKKLATILKSVVSRNDHTSSECLFYFSSHCLKLPQRRVQVMF